MVSSAAEGIPIVAFATPFSTEEGKGVFSGALDVQRSPIGQRYLSSFSTLEGRRVYIVDSSGHIAATSHEGITGEISDSQPQLAVAMNRADSGHFETGGQDHFFASAGINGTEWRMVLTVPSDVLYGSIDGARRLISWAVFGVLLAVSVAVLFLLARSTRQGTALSEANEDLARTNREIVVLAQELEERSLVDPLTGVRNRRGFEVLVGHMMREANRDDDVLALMFIDLDRMKTINDVHGHVAGDDALMAVAQVTSSCCRETDVVARLGGDEFVVAIRREYGTAFVQDRILEAISERNSIVDYELSVSIGMVDLDPKVSSLTDAIALADVSMYRQKRSHNAAGTNPSPLVLDDEIVPTAAA